MLVELLKAALAAIPAAASSGYALIAYGIAIAACVFFVWRVSRNKNLLKHIEKLPPKDRLRALEQEMGAVPLAKRLSPEEWLRARIQRYYLYAFLAVCAVVVAIVALAVRDGAKTVQIVNTINNDYRQFNNGQELSNSDLQRIRNVVEAAVGRDTARARAAFGQLSAPARASYVRTYESEKDNLIAPDELSPAASQVTISTKEAEPNDDVFKANEVPLNAAISAAIESKSDLDYFTFMTPRTRRDYIDVVLDNESTTLAPTVTIYNPDKSQGPYQTNRTRGGNVSLAFVAQPDSRYYVRVEAYEDRGSYRLTVRARNAYDRYEPNDTILQTSPIAIGQAIEANIMDSKDIDYYTFETANQAKFVVQLENRSSTLAPTMTVYKPDKSQGPYQTNRTGGGDVSLAFEAAANSRYYVRVEAYSNSGEYRLTVRPQ